MQNTKTKRVVTMAMLAARAYIVVLLAHPASSMTEAEIPVRKKCFFMMMMLRMIKGYLTSLRLIRKSLQSKRGATDCR